MLDMVIVGAGTAGMTAAIYGRRAGKRVLLLEEGIYGGQIVNTPEVENYPGIQNITGFQFAMNLYEQATGLGAELETGKVIGVRTLLEDKDEQSGFEIQTEDACFETKSIIIATGAKHRTLGLARETELTGRGVSYCAACDGAFFREQVVAVVGGGNTALGDAEYLSNLCKQVYVIHRREEFRGDAKLIEQLERKENVEFIRNAVVTELFGDEHLEGIQIENVATKERKNLAVKGLFVAVGHAPDNRAFAELVQLDASGYVVASENCKTNVPGIFVAGDCRTKQVRQLTTAAADGAVAALAAVDYLNAGQ